METLVLRHAQEGLLESMAEYIEVEKILLVDGMEDEVVNVFEV